MAPKIFAKLFKREHKTSERYGRPKVFSPNAIGISNSTCEVNGDPFDGWKLPIPAPRQDVMECRARQRITQQTSRFFHLPEEVRRIIYIELMGNRRVHIEHSWMLPSPFQPKVKQKGKRWDWWHGVCQISDSFIRDTSDDRCWDRGDERFAHRTEGLTSPPPGTKLGGVEWLRCCQIGYEEALPVLYGTNVFVPREGIDSPFIMSKVLPSTCAQLIQSMDISFWVWHGLDGTPEAKSWTAVYPALFDLLEKCFCNLHRLRVTVKLPAWERVKETMSQNKIDGIMAPWKKLAMSRDWTRLEFRVPFDWHPIWAEKAESQNRWELTMNGWYDRMIWGGCGV